jgi:lysophospholipase L1-like esterase
MTIFSVNYRLNATLFTFSLLSIFLLIEIGYRLFDPFPFYSDLKSSLTEHSIVSKHDSLLGWQGIPNIQKEFYLSEQKTRITHNNHGFRDTSHPQDQSKEGIIFLGDSFTWGYGVNDKEIFVNRLRDHFHKFELYNLAYPGYGTDQSLLQFKFYPFKQKLKVVLLAVSENDFLENILPQSNHKPKPYFELKENTLFLKNVPVPEYKFKERYDGFTDSQLTKDENWKEFFFNSHFLHDVYFRIKNISKKGRHPNSPKNQIPSIVHAEDAIMKTILGELKKDVEAQGAKFLVIAIPSKKEFIKTLRYRPYQQRVAAICKELDVPFLDLKPALSNVFPRKYYRIDNHWTRHGHRAAAKAIQPFIHENLNQH